jgi:hypothetical protein
MRSKFTLICAAVSICLIAASCASVRDAYDNEIVLGVATTQVTALAQAGKITVAQHQALNTAIHTAQLAIQGEFAAASAGSWTGYLKQIGAGSALADFLIQLSQIVETIK